MMRDDEPTPANGEPAGEESIESIERQLRAVRRHPELMGLARGMIDEAWARVARRLAREFTPEQRATVARLFERALAQMRAKGEGARAALHGARAREPWIRVLPIARRAAAASNPFAALEAAASADPSMGGRERASSRSDRFRALEQDGGSAIADCKSRTTRFPIFVSSPSVRHVDGAIAESRPPRWSFPLHCPRATPPGLRDADLLFRIDPCGSGTPPRWSVSLRGPGVRDVAFEFDFTPYQTPIERDVKPAAYVERGTRLFHGLLDAVERSACSSGKAARAAVARYFRPEDDSAARRLVLFAGTSAGALLAGPLAAGALPWEHLGDGANRPIPSGRVHLVRAPAAPAGDASDSLSFPNERRAKVRVLLIVGAIDQDERAPDRARELADAAHRVVEALRTTSCEVTLAVGLGSTMPSRGREPLTTSPEIGTCSAKRLLAAVRQGGGYDVLHFLGHSDASPDAPAEGARHLLLRPAEGDGEPAEWLSIEQLAAALRTANGAALTRLVVLQCCRLLDASALALLTAVDHVVGVAESIDPQGFAAMNRAFYGRLDETGSVDAAVTAVRKAGDFDRKLAHHVTHWARTLDPQVFLAPADREVELYRRGVVADHGRLLGPIFEEIFREHANDVLGDVYVDLGVEIASDRAKAPLGSLDAPAASDPTGDRCATALTLRQLIRTHHPTHRDRKIRWTLLGPPGSGKTTLLRCLTRDLAESRDKLPVYRHLGDVKAPPRSGGLAHWLAGDRQSLAERLRERDRLQECVVLIDGLDEVADETAARELLKQIADEWNSPVVVAGRLLGSRLDLLPAGFARAEVLPLDDPRHPDAPHTVRRLCERWMAARGRAQGRPPTAEELREQTDALVARIARLEPDLRRAPLFLHLAAYVHERTGSDGPLPPTRAALAREFLDCLIRARHKPHALFPAVDDARSFLRELGVTLAEKNVRSMQRSDLVAWVERLEDCGGPASAARRRLYDKICGTGPLAREFHGQPGRFVDRLSFETGVLVERGTGDPRIEFFVKTFQDLCTAEWLHRTFPVDGDAVTPATDGGTATAIVPHGTGMRTQRAGPGGASRRAHRPEDGDPRLDWVQSTLGRAKLAARLDRWGEPLALVTSLLDSQSQREAWLRRLKAQSPELALRALAHAGAIDGALFIEILDLADDWDSRAQALAELRQRLPDDTALPALLAGAARATNRIDDLAVIDDALRELGLSQHAGERRDVLGRIIALASEQATADTPAGALDATVLRAAFAEVPGLADRGVAAAARRLWRRIPKGRFLMGSSESERERYNDEVPHLVELSEDYWIAAVPVTLRQYRTFDPRHEQEFDSDPDLPAIDVSWYEARAFCRWLTAQIGALGIDEIRRTLEIELTDAELEVLRSGAKRLVVSLPTEAQWERAARGSEEQARHRFWCGDELTPEYAVFGWDWGEGPQPVARWSDATHRVVCQANGGRWSELPFTRQANAFGLYDVHGNVWEWCADGFGDYEVGNDGTPVVDPRGASSGGGRVVRGRGFGSGARDCRSAYRDGNGPWSRNWNLGFRVALSLVAVPQLGASSLDH